MRVLTLLVALVGFGGAGAACQESVGADGDANATIDQSVPACGPGNSCPSGASCAYPALVGCAAKGECRSFEAPDSSLCSTDPTTYCGCDGKTVDVPACWNGFAPAPVVDTEQPTCADAK